MRVIKESKGAPLNAKVGKAVSSETVLGMDQDFYACEYTYKGWLVTGITQQTADEFMLHIRKDDLSRVVTAGASELVTAHAA